LVGVDGLLKRPKRMGLVEVEREEQVRLLLGVGLGLGEREGR
jgi:hypothetical protein